MGSLKEDMRGLRDDHQPCEKTDDGGRPADSGSSTSAEGTPLQTSQESTTRDDCQPELHTNTGSVEEGHKNPASKDQVFSGVDCDNTDKSDFRPVIECTQTDEKPLTPAAAAREATGTQNEATISVILSNDADPEGKTIENILVPLPLTPKASDPQTPAPFGQHHMRTQVSLEVVQCCSAATSPMTPPEGCQSFFFPSTFGKSGGAGTDTKDAELQVGPQVEFCSVATSPMTPKTPSATAFPELVGREVARKEETVGKSEETMDCGQRESFAAAKSPAETRKHKTAAMKSVTSKELSQSLGSNASPGSSTSCSSARLIDSQATLEDSNQHCKQQRMGSMDQDITILVTHYGNNDEEEEEEGAYFHSTETEMGEVDEYEAGRESKSGIKCDDKTEKTSKETPGNTKDVSNTNPEQKEPKGPRASMKAEHSGVTEDKDTREEAADAPVTKPHIPESPAPFGCHNIRTQVSLEVVQCQSAATSPMTPPEGDHTFFFPSSFGKCGAVGTVTKDAELQKGPQVEFRSVATAPMTPRTPTAATFPEIRKEPSIEEKRVMEEEDEKEQLTENKNEAYKDDNQVTTEEKAEEDKEEIINCTEGEDTCEEPVQEVSWDEKGMTWEVYGAVVEVAVLGSAIQKHLEKQVKKQKKQSSMPPPPPLNPSATPLTSEHIQKCSGKGREGKRGEQDGKVSRRRRNPFRLLMENMQQPHCCSRSQSAE
ncbi:uncharacterized protein LOC133447347 [Cololabis saira]|uniref:uncharacterized protein LOC133447347 n=1 Tax=Cololabis saira TaxID=129043 RepID=UPI002AD592C0|nr:uncharacterized protein LOC133447347 [Cololabis saira]